MENHKLIQETSPSPECTYTFCCPNVRLNYPYSSDCNPCAMNQYFQTFQTYINNNGNSLEPYIIPLTGPQYYFEVTTMRYTPLVNKLSKKYARRETNVRWFVPCEKRFLEIIRELLPAGDYEPPGFPTQQMWMCWETRGHSTQFIVRLHHRHYSRVTEQMVEIEQLTKEGCEVCDALAEHKEMQNEAYSLSDLYRWAGDGQMGLGPEFTWERGTMINMGLIGDEVILDYDAVEGQWSDGTMDKEPLSQSLERLDYAHILR